MQPTIDPLHVAITEPVRDSDIPVRLMYVETADGLYAPIGLRTPPGTGPFPLVLFASGNGGGGMAAVREATENRSWTQEQFLAAGYAVAWTRYRAEVDYAYDRIGRLIADRRQHGLLLNRGPLEYEDVIAIAEYAKTLPGIAADRIGYMGMSHGGEMAFKIASEYHGVRAMIASEPAAHEFLRLRPDASARINPSTGLLDVENLLMREVEKVRSRITQDVAAARISTITTPIFVQGRNSDLLRSAGRGRQAGPVGDLRARRARLRLCAAQPRGCLRTRSGAAPRGAGLDRLLRRPYEGALTRTGAALQNFTRRTCRGKQRRLAWPRRLNSPATQIGVSK